MKRKVKKEKNCIELLRGINLNKTRYPTILAINCVIINTFDKLGCSILFIWGQT